MTLSRDVGKFSTDLDGQKSGREWTDDARDSLLALWGLSAGVFNNVAGTNSITASLDVGAGFNALTDGLAGFLKPANTTTGAVLFNLAGLGNKAVVSADGVALPAGSLVAGTLYFWVFLADDDHWRVIGSTGITNVTVNGGLQVQRTEPVRLFSAIASSTVIESIVTRTLQMTYSTSRVIVEGAVSLYTTAGTTNGAGIVVGLYVDGVLIESITSAAVGDRVISVPFYFSYLPADTDNHTYEIRCSSTIAATYPVSTSYLVCSEITPN